MGRCANDTLFIQVAGPDVQLPGTRGAVRSRQVSGTLVRQVRSSGTMTRDLRALADYPQSWCVTHVVRESTGVLWQPVWEEREAGLAARRGRKREWVAVCHSPWTIIDDGLWRGVQDRDLGADDIDRLPPERRQRHLVRRLQVLGDEVTATPKMPTVAGLRQLASNERTALT